MRKFKMGIRRFGASLSALLLVCCMTVPALAAGNNWPFSPPSSDFVSHAGSWYVWQDLTLSSVPGFELICTPMQEYGSSNTSYYTFDSSYSTNSSTYSINYSSDSRTDLMYSFPYIPYTSPVGSWSVLPSFPVGEPSYSCGAVRVYPVIWRDFLQNISDVFVDRSIFGFLTSWPSSSPSTLSDSYEKEILTQYPVFVPSNIFFFGDRSVTSTNVTGFGIRNGDNDFWATPFNGKYLKLNDSHFSSNFKSFPPNFSIPSSDVGFVFCKQPEGNQMHPYNTEFNVTLSFVSSLWIPATLLPSDVQVGDWISKGDVEGLQDQLVKDFDVNSDTLKNSKQNFDSWQNSNTIDTAVADTGLNIINSLLQNVGQFAFVVSLLCFGAVVLRVLIRKAVEG